MDNNEETIKIRKSTIVIGVVLILIIIAGFLVYNYRSYFFNSDEDVQHLKANIKLQVIVLSVDCEKCIDEEIALNLIKSEGDIELTKERIIESDSEKGKALIKQYEIEKLPAFIFVGDIDKLTSENFRKIDNKAILEPVAPPFVDVKTGDVQGIIDVTFIVDKECNECFDIKILRDLFEQSFFMVFGEERTIDISSSEGKELLRKHSITNVPTLIFSKDAKLHPVMEQLWPQIGKISSEEYVLTELNKMPNIKYKDLIKNEIVITEVIEE